MLNFYQKRTLSNTIRLMTILYMLCICQLAIAQTKNFQGVVKDAKGNTLPGVTILETGTSNGVSTNIDGIFEIKLRPGSTLTVSYIGYITRTIPTNDKTTFLNIILEEDVFQLDDVVVVGYGSMKKGEVTSAITSVKKDDFLAGMVKSPEQLLQGKVAGLQLSNYTGDPVLGLEMTIRGVNSLSGNTSPLIVIDGIPGGSLTAISSEDIESIDVLKDGSAAAIYGTRGTNGVIVITTNRAKATKLSMEYNGSISFETFAKHADMLTANDYRRLTDDPDFPGIQDEGTTTDWTGGKMRGITTNNQISNLPVFRLPEMYLIQAEAYAKQSNPDYGKAKEKLLEVAAKRNPDLDDSEIAEDQTIIDVIDKERKLELVQEGHRFFDARRLGKIISVADGAYTNFNIAKFVYPIPSFEVNSGFGVIQTEGWSDNLPR